MASKAPTSYNNVIANTVDKALTLSKDRSKSIAGFCPLQGPTGGGKSSALYRQESDGTPAAIEYVRDKGLKAIFVTHRWNILHDVYAKTHGTKDSKGKKLKVSVIYSQTETIVSAITQRPLPHETDLCASDLPNMEIAIEYLHSHGLFDNNDNIKKYLLKDCADLMHSVGLVQTLESQEYANSSIQRTLDKEKQMQVSLSSNIERTLLEGLQGIEAQASQYEKELGASHQKTLAAKRSVEAIRQNRWLRRIFPAIAWRDSNHDLLILTTHKFFGSFYDGKQKVRMSSSKLNGLVIFIDEFDYQADILQTALAQSQVIREPPECIGQLLENGRRLLSRLAMSDTPSSQRVHRDLSVLLDKLKAELDEYGIDLQDSRALVAPIDSNQGISNFRSKYLFRSDHLVTNEHLKMRQQSHGFEVLEGDPVSPGDIDVGVFLRIMEKYIKQLTTLTLQATPSGIDGDRLLRELHKRIFDPFNDNRPSYYGQNLARIGRYAVSFVDIPELHAMARSNLLPNTASHINGLATWLLTKETKSENLDPLKINIKRAYLPTTSEGLITALASRNLVFGLSATSYIERAVGHFDVRWIEGALRYIAQARQEGCEKSYLGNHFGDKKTAWISKPVPYVQNEADKASQMEVVQRIVREKAAIRQSTLDARIHNFDIAICNEALERVGSVLPGAFFDTFDSQKYIYEHRKGLLLKLIHTIQLAASTPEHKGHLVFVNSVRYLYKWLTHDGACESRRILDGFDIERMEDVGLTSAQARALRPFRGVFIPVRMQGHPMLLCILRAEVQKREGFSRAYQAAFDSGRAVMILTQNATATNGINLDYSLPHAKGQMDITSLFIIESKHFYFGKDEDGMESMAIAGNQLRNIDKLTRSHEFSRFEMRKSIMPIMERDPTGITNINNTYRKTNDYTKNTVADLQQQVGRIERAWNHVPKVSIHICHHIAQQLQRFNELSVCTRNRGWMSTLNVQLLDAVASHETNTTSFVQGLMQSSVQPGDEAIDIIDNQIVPAIRKSRSVSSDIAPMTRLWHELGRAVLQHDFAWQPSDKRLARQLGIDRPLRAWACFNRPAKVSMTGDIWYNPSTWQFTTSRGPDFRRYDPQRLYEVVHAHPCMVRWFKNRSYQTSITPYANDIAQEHAFHPVVVQRLLQGRIGEECIRALLSHHTLSTTQTLKSNALFEVYDFEIAKSNIFVDAKYWSDGTIERAESAHNHWSHEATGSDPLGLTHKLQQIRKVHGPQAILVTANLITSKADASLIGFTSSMQRCDVNDADILMLGGCVTDPKTTFAHVNGDHANDSTAVTSGLLHLIELSQARLPESK